MALVGGAVFADNFGVAFEEAVEHGLGLAGAIEGHAHLGVFIRHGIADDPVRAALDLGRGAAHCHAVGWGDHSGVGHRPSDLDPQPAAETCPRLINPLHPAQALPN